jgi:hypothetical protein
LNGKELTEDQLKHPIELKDSKNELSVVKGDDAATIGMIEVTPGDDQKSFAVYDKEKGFVKKRLHRLLAEWALALLRAVQNGGAGRPNLVALGW